MKFHRRRFGGSCLNLNNPKVEDNSADANNPIPPHLVIMVNGIVGSSADWRYGAEQFLKRLPDKVIVHRKKISVDRYHCIVYVIHTALF